MRVCAGRIDGTAGRVNGGRTDAHAGVCFHSTRKREVRNSCSSAEIRFFNSLRSGLHCLDMIHRRGFFHSIAGLGVAAANAQAAEDDRQYWLRQLTRIADPVLENLAAGTLKRNMPVECAGGKLEERRRYTHLEAVGRLLAGIAPWLEVELEAELEAGAERDLQQRYRDLARAALGHATDPASPDFLNFHEGSRRSEERRVGDVG